VAESSASPNAVEVGVRRSREVKVDDDVEGLNVNPAGEDVGANKVAALPLAEVMENTVAIFLAHLPMNVEARETQSGNLAAQKLDSVHAVAENNALVNCNLSEESIKAVNFLVFIHIGVILGEALQGEIVHEVDDFARRKPFGLEFLNCAREGRGKQ